MFATKTISKIIIWNEKVVKKLIFYIIKDCFCVEKIFFCLKIVCIYYETV